MATLQEQIKNLERLSQKVIVKKIFEGLKLAEAKVIQANKNQLVLGKDVEGNVVGEYSPYTEAFAEKIFTPKTPGMPYNFQWTGEFYKGFNLKVSGEEATISSTGVGSGGKKEFLTTNNLFGLNEEELGVIIQKEILPFIQKFSRETLNI